MTTLICPRCHQRLSVSDLAPQRLTCPNCLAALINPRWGQAPAPSAAQPPAAVPRRVFSVDYQVQRDTRGSVFALAAFAVVLAGAAALSFRIPGGAKVGTALALFAVLCGATIYLQWRYKPD